MFPHFVVDFPVPFCFRCTSFLVTRSLRSSCLRSSPFEQRYDFLSQDGVETLASPKSSFTSPSLSCDVFFSFLFFDLESVLDFFKDLFGARPCRWRLHSLCLSLDTLWSSRFRNPDTQRSIVL